MAVVRPAASPPPDEVPECPEGVPGGCDYDTTIREVVVGSVTDRRTWVSCWVWLPDERDWYPSAVSRWTLTASGWWASVEIRSMPARVHAWRLRPRPRRSAT